MTGKRVRPVEQFSFFPFEKELLYPPNSQFRVTGLWDPTSFNIRQGTQVSESEFQIATDFGLPQTDRHQLTCQPRHPRAIRLQHQGEGCPHVHAVPYRRAAVRQLVAKDL